MTQPVLARGTWFTILILWFAGICAAMQFAKMSIAFGELQRELGVSASLVSTLMGATGLFGLIFGVSGAAIARSIGYRRVLLGSLYIAALLSFAEAGLPSVETFYALRLLEGITNLLIVVAAPTLMSAHAPPGRLPFVMGLWGTFYGVGFAVAGVVGPQLLAIGGSVALQAAHGVLTIVIALLLTARPLAQTPVAPRDKIGLAQMFRQQVSIIVAAYRKMRTSLPGLLFFFHSSIYLGLLVFLPSFAPHQALTQFLFVAMPLISICGTLTAGFLVQAGVSAGRVLLCGFALLALLLCGFLVPEISTYGGGSMFVALCCAAILVSGVLQGGIFVLTSHLAANPGEEALAFGLIAQLGSLGSILGPVIFANLIELGGLNAFALSSLAGIVLATLVAALGLWRVSPNFVARTITGPKPNEIGPSI